MVLVKGTKGKKVQVDIKGIGDTINRLRKRGLEVENDIDLGLLRAANYVSQELQESIIGNRSEPRSVIVVGLLFYYCR